MNTFNATVSKQEVFTTISASITEMGFNVIGKDDHRPWGGFFVIEESQAALFIASFFPHLSIEGFEGFEKLSPKILVVAPEKRLSWQYHHRRAEIWKVIGGIAGVVISDSDEEKPLKKLGMGEVVELQKGERHRLVGLETWGIIAEIWKHTDPLHPSDEDDIVRVQDDFGR